AELIGYFDRLIDDRRRDPGDDFMSTLIEGAFDEGRMSRDELIANCIFVAGAGHVTTARILCNGANALLRDPTLRARLAADPSLPRPAVEEVCRWEPPVQITPRIMRSAM